MTVEALEPGDVVRLKSGGPAMTVEEVRDDGASLLCVWFQRGGKQQSIFKSAMLEPFQLPTPDESDS